MRGYLTKEDIRGCDTEPSRADMDDCFDSILESPGSNAISTEIEKDGDDYDDSEYACFCAKTEDRKDYNTSI